jgi:DNA-binding LacI/PurR family transcriptional regulator
MADVAAVAGVSHQTVSRVLNGLPGVRTETKERVEAAIAELGYRRNLAARVLASARSQSVGVISWGTWQFGPANVLLGLEAAARDTAYRLELVNISSISPDAFHRAVNQLLERAVEALVVIVSHEAVLGEAQALDIAIPVLVVEGDLSRTPLTAGVDNVEGARVATRHLLELGHRTVHHLAGPAGWAEARARIDGWEAELAAWGLEVPTVRWIGDWSAASGYQAGRSIAGDPRVTAVFAANDQMALGVMRALHEAGRRVPDELSVVGFDDLPEARFFVPALTTVQQDFPELGRRVMQLLARVLDHGERPGAVLVPTHLRVRESTAPPR